MKFKNRIIGSGTEDPQKLIPNPKNFRKHPANQNNALSGALKEVGWIQQVIVNKKTGNIVDGHLRVELAKANKEKSVPVIYVDLSEADEALALATLDPIAAMAETDKAKLEELLNGIESNDANIMQFIEDLRLQEGLYIEQVEKKDLSENVKESYEIIISCANELEQESFFNRFVSEGLRCRVLTL